MVAVGHWKDLAEAEKLTENVLVAGIIEENIKEGGVIGTLPVAQFQGKLAKWNRESTIPTAQTAGRGSLLSWQEATETDLRELGLKTVYIQTVLDQFIPEVHGNFNNYTAIQLLQDRKAMLQKLEDLALYGDESFSAGNLEFDGFHALAQASPTNFDGDSLDIDEGEAGLSLANLRLIEDRMKHGIDYWLFPKTIARRLDAYIQEAGLSTNTFGQISFGMDDLGKRVTSWNGKPILRSDYLVAEQSSTGEGSNARAKRTSGDNQFSVFAVKLGQVMVGEPGMTFMWGNKTPAPGMLWKEVFFPNLEDFDAAGIRMVNYSAIADGSTMSLARIRDIEDVAIIA